MNWVDTIGNNVVFSVCFFFGGGGLLKLLNFLKYWSSFLTITGTTFVCVSIWKYIPVGKKSQNTSTNTTCITYLQILVAKSF